MKRMCFFFVAAVLFTLGCQSKNHLHSTADIQFTVDNSKIVGENHKFWKACGYDFLYKIVNEPEGGEFLDRAQKNNSIKYYRTHYTFSNNSHVSKRAGGNICGQVVTFDEEGKTRYDFSRVNKTFKEYVRRDMKPIVEFDFYPDGFAANRPMVRNDEAFTTWSGPPKSWDQWQALLNAFMQNLVNEFGKEELKTWYFEVWNEPDGWADKDIPNFYRLYDVFAHTVKSYDADFKVGGPACYHLHFLKGFLDHVVHGKNYVTGEKGSPIDFISFHMYGLSGSWLSPAPEIYPMVSKFTADMLWWQRLMKDYPELKNAEIHLNEWGLCSHGDSKFVAEFPQLEYRNSEVSALFMVKFVDCLYAIEDNYNFRTDMMLYWGAWFNAGSGPIFMGSRDLMTAGCIPKPILTAYEMLAKLGDHRLLVSGPKPGGRYGVLAAKSSQAIQLLAYNFQETDDDFNRKDHFSINLESLSPSGTVTVTEYRMDRSNNNTYRYWENIGKPAATSKVIQQIKQAGQLSVTGKYEVEIKNGQIEINDMLSRHSMCLYVCQLNN